MNYEKLKIAARRNSLPLKVLAEKIGMTDAGFHKAIKEDSFRVAALERAAEVLAVSVCEFFDCNKNTLNESNAIYESAFKEKYFTTLEKYNKMLEDNMELRRKIIFLESNGKK